MSAFGSLMGLAGRMPRHSQQWSRTGWLGSKGILAFVALSVALLALVALPTTPAFSWDDGSNKIQGPCPGPIFRNTTLVGDIVAGSEVGAGRACIEFAADNIKLDMDGFFVDVRSRPDIRGVATNGHTNVRIDGNDGFVLTSYTLASDTSCVSAPPFGSPCAIHIGPCPAAILGVCGTGSGGNVRVRDIRVRNVFGPVMPVSQTTVLTSTTCAPEMSRGGAGVFMGPGIHKAKITDLFVECYGLGIRVFQSNGDADSDDLIGHNFLEDNGITNGADDSAGLVLDTANGWLVTRNTFTGNGRAGDTTGVDSNIIVTASSNNVFIKNMFDNNSGPGMSVGAGSVNNKIMRNHATFNSSGLAAPLGWDLGDDNMLGANTYKDNLCRMQRGTGVPPQCNSSNF